MAHRQKHTLATRLNWHLAPLSKIPPAALLPQENPSRLERLFLALALVFNDLKGLFWISTMLTPAEAFPEGITKERGQLAGMRIQLFRQGVGLLHELLELLHRERVVVTSTEFQTLVRQLHPHAQMKWAELVQVALERRPDRSGGPPTTFYNGLKRVRNCTAFHYDQTHRLAEGYIAHFHSGQAGGVYESAFYSDGRNAEQTRFYYADAAVNATIELQTGQDNAKWSKMVVDLSMDVNDVLKPLIVAFIESRARSTGQG